MTLLARFLGLPAWVHRVLLGALIGIAVLAVIIWLRSDAVSDERAAVLAATQAAQIAQNDRERQADQNRRDAEAAARVAADQRKQEINDATRNLPDQAPSARQRARVCVELRRQAAAAGRPQPAC